MATPRRPRKPTKPPAKPSKKGSYHHGDLRRALLDAGLALIEEQGAQAFTLREAARRAGVSQAAPYRHFADKDALLGAIAEEGFRGLTASMRAEVAREGTPAGVIEPVGMGYLLFAAQNPAHYRVMFGPRTNQDAIPASTHAAGQESFQVLLDGVDAAQRAGIMRAGDTMELALYAWSVVHGFALLVIDGIVPGLRPSDPSDPSDPGRASEMASEIAFRQLAARMLRLTLEGTAARNDRDA